VHRQDVALDRAVDPSRPLRDALLRHRWRLDGRRRSEILVEDLVAEANAFIADVDAGAGDQLHDLPLRLAAEVTAQL
jgi:hypothetical protein